MKFIFQVLTTVALAVGAVALEEGVQLGQGFGGPHGNKYSDLDLVSPGQQVRSITLHAGECVNGVGLDLVDPRGAPFTVYHGGRGGDKNTLSLAEGEYITGIEAHWGKTWSKTRIRYIKFTTNLGNIISGGSKTTKVGEDTAPEGYQLGGIDGFADKELDVVAAIWTKIESDGRASHSSSLCCIRLQT